MTVRHDPLALLARLGADVDRRWSARRFEAAAFPELARAALVRCRVHEGFELRSLVARVLAPEPLPHASVRFEEPVDAPVFPLFASRRVAVELHVYGPSMTTIHDHDFDAAIVNLEGESLLSTFAFDGARAAALHVETGRLRLERLERMPRGGIELVHAGRRTIHRVVHLANRTSMLVVRTRTSRRQHLYFEAGLAIRVFSRAEKGRPPLHDARAKMLGFLAASDPTAAHRFLMRLLRTSDAWSTAAYALDNWDYLGETGALVPALAACRKRLGAWVDRLADVHEARRCAGQVAWTTLARQEDRLVAALRLTLGDRAREREWAAAHAPLLDIRKTSRRLSRTRRLTR